MLKTETKQIGELALTVQQFPALRALRLMTRLGAIISPVLSRLDGLTMDSDVQQLAPALGELFTRLGDVEAAALATELLAASYVIRDDKRIELTDSGRIDLIFSGDLRGLLTALMFAIQVNFGDFFGDALAGGAIPSSSPAESGSDSTQTSPKAG